MSVRLELSQRRRQEWWGLAVFAVFLVWLVVGMLGEPGRWWPIAVAYGVLAVLGIREVQVSRGAQRLAKSPTIGR